MIYSKFILETAKLERRVGVEGFGLEDNHAVPAGLDRDWDVDSIGCRSWLLLGSRDRLGERRCRSRGVGGRNRRSRRRRSRCYGL